MNNKIASGTIPVNNANIYFKIYGEARPILLMIVV